jgi:hypothetical protein
MDEFRALNDETELIMYGKRRRVKNVETGMVYLSMSAAARDVDAGRGTINKVLDNPTRTAGGYHWITA